MKMVPSSHAPPLIIAREQPRLISSLLSVDENTRNTLLYCSLLALQFGLQPMIAARLTPASVSKSSVVIAIEVQKIVIAVMSLLFGPTAELEKLRSTWTLKESFAIAALPSLLYMIQNMCVQYGYEYLDSTTFTLLNQTKTISAAFWMWILMGQPQSAIQIVSLFMLLVAAMMLNVSPSSAASSLSKASPHYRLGFTAVATASMLSGVSAALIQRSLVGKQSRNIVFLSAEMAVYGIVLLLANLFFNNDLPAGGFFANWNAWILVPITTSALGGLIVGQVTKYAGPVVKGFALIAGIVISALAQWLVEGKPLGTKDFGAMVLVSVAIYLHNKFPPAKPLSAAKKVD